MIIWIIGLSGAGKTTLGREVFERLKSTSPNTVFLDGDDIRKYFRQDTEELDYSVEGRRKNGDRIQKICAWLDAQDINVVCCILSLFPEMQRQNRVLFSSYYEIYLKVPMEELFLRDPKGIYKSARAGGTKNVVGLDIDFPEPPSPDIVFENDCPIQEQDKLVDLIL